MARARTILRIAGAPGGNDPKPEARPVDAVVMPPAKGPAPTSGPPSSAELRARLDGLFREYGVEPAEELIRLATWRRQAEDGQQVFVLPADQRIKVWTELLKYRMPTLKSTEIHGEVDHSITVVVRKFGEGDTVIERKLADIPQAVPVKGVGIHGMLADKEGAEMKKAGL